MASDHFTAMSERELKAKVTELAFRLGWLVFSNAQSKPTRPVRKAIGYPDLTLAREGRVLWIECKAPGGTTTSEQDAWLRELPHAFVIKPIDWYSGKVAEMLI